MEKILLGAYLSVLAAFITAAASIVKLVNEKESKTTDYRQSWTDSVRGAMSQLIGSISLQSTYLHHRADLQNKTVEAHEKTYPVEREAEKASLQSFLTESLKELNSNIRENRQNINKYYALTTLHFKPSDEIFGRIEHKYSELENLLIQLGNANNPEQDGDRRELKEKIASGVAELTNTARFILKTEWEHVKAGEPAYRKTKAWSLNIGIAAFAILVFCGIYMLAYYQLQQSSATNAMAPSTSVGSEISNRRYPPESDFLNQQLININTTSCPAVSNQGKSSSRPPCSQQVGAASQSTR